MPAPAEILAQLTAMTRELAWLAVGWHLVLLAAVAATVAGWRPSHRVGVWLLATPASSVAIAAFGFGNPFNGISFAVLALGLVAAGAAAPSAPAARGPAWAAWLGVALIVYGGCYPHFVDGAWYRALYVAPIGVVPCPTLATMAGFTLMAGGFGTGAVHAWLAAWSAFYAGFGILRLGVLLDVGLLVATGALGVQAMRRARGRKS